MTDVLQFSAGQGPAECAMAVNLAVLRFLRDAQARGFEALILAFEEGRERSTLRSAIVKVTNPKDESLNELTGFMNEWTGTFQWVCRSPFRPHYGRKNWFFNVHRWSLLKRQSIDLEDCQFTMCRSSGAGGQHINKTESAVIVRHRPTGVSVRVESERSQHRNRQVAMELLAAKIANLAIDQESALRKRQRLQHHQVIRGNAVRTFSGMAFDEIGKMP